MLLRRVCTCACHAFTVLVSSACGPCPCPCLLPQVRKLGPNANPAVLKTLPIASGAMWAFYFG